MAVLGAKIASETAWLALAPSSDRIIVGHPDRYSMPKRPRPEALLAAKEDFLALLREHRVDCVRVLDGGGRRGPASYKQARKRFSLELALEFAAAELSVPFDVVSASTVASRLGLQSKALDDHVDHLPSAGTRWRERSPAALAAISLWDEQETQ